MHTTIHRICDMTHLLVEPYISEATTIFALVHRGRRVWQAEFEPDTRPVVDVGRLPRYVQLQAAMLCQQLDLGWTV